MREHAKKGNIVFFSSHLIDIVESLCDKIAVIKKGNILTVEDVKNIEKNTTLEEYYLKITSTDVKAVKYKDASEDREETLKEEIARKKEEKAKKKEEKNAKRAEKIRAKAEAKAKKLETKETEENK